MVRPSRSLAVSEVPITTKQKQNRANEAFSFGKLVDAVTKYVTSAIVLGGRSLTAPAMVALIQAYLKAQADLDGARSTVVGKQKDRDAARSAARALRRPLHDWAKATFGADSPVLAEFGFAPAKAKAKTTVITKAQAAQKGSTTRQSNKTALAKVKTQAAEPATPAPTAAPTKQ